jgi:hypothetical protein
MMVMDADIVWQESFTARLEALALLETLNAELLSHDSATLTLDHWCAAHRLASPERPRLRTVIALCLGVTGLVLLMGANLGGGVGGQRYATIPSSEVDGRDQSATPHSDLRDWR